ncbi:MAG: hypothetical protein JNK23_22870 [Opitutaceae bacterium]|nr:hypothetical protein [Opitutaceae bacterium]
MNRIALALLAATALTAASARADTRVSFGFSIGAPAYRPAPPPAVVYAPAPQVVYAPPAPAGYWKDVVVKTWVPERTYVRHNRWGRPERVCEPGYFTYTTNRVWVPVDTHCAPPPAYSYGWGRR